MANSAIILCISAAFTVSDAQLILLLTKKVGASHVRHRVGRQIPPFPHYYGPPPLPGAPGSGFGFYDPMGDSVRQHMDHMMQSVRSNQVATEQAAFSAMQAAQQQNAGHGWYGPPQSFPNFAANNNKGAPNPPMTTFILDAQDHKNQALVHSQQRTPKGELVTLAQPVSNASEKPLASDGTVVSRISLDKSGNTVVKLKPKSAPNLKQNKNKSDHSELSDEENSESDSATSDSDERGNKKVKSRLQDDANNSKSKARPSENDSKVNQRDSGRSDAEGDKNQQASHHGSEDNKSKSRSRAGNRANNSQKANKHKNNTARSRSDSKNEAQAKKNSSKKSEGNTSNKDDEEEHLQYSIEYENNGSKDNFKKVMGESVQDMLERMGFDGDRIGSKLPKSLRSDKRSNTTQSSSGGSSGPGEGEMLKMLTAENEAKAKEVTDGRGGLASSSTSPPS